MSPMNEAETSKAVASGGNIPSRSAASKGTAGAESR
jgi:hypothetical protein